jgi:ribosomal protein S18 acetylase RimI-like enzyme
MAVTIRRATAQDYEAVCEIIEQVDALHREALPHIFRESGGPVRERVYMLDLLADEDHGLFVVEVERQVVGFLHVTVRDAPPIPILVPRRVAVVDNIAVKEAHRRAGLGRALMSRAEQWAQAKGAVEVELNVYEFNETAIAFYERLGYQAFSRRMGKRLD